MLVFVLSIIGQHGYVAGTITFTDQQLARRWRDHYRNKGFGAYVVAASTETREPPNEEAAVPVAV